MSSARDPQQQRDQAGALCALHRSGEPLRLVNVWDATSARVAQAAGAAAVGTSSFAVALAHGTADGEHLSFDAVLASIDGIVAATDLPVSVDLESGRGATAAEVGASATEVIRHGAVGLNIEDSVPSAGGTLFSIEDQVARLEAVRAAADHADVPVFLNARSDLWFGAQVDAADRLDQALVRAEAYAGAGADGLFLPGLYDLEVLATISSNTTLAVSVMVDPSIPSIAELAAAGVRRVSQGASSFLATMGGLSQINAGFLGDSLAPPMELLGAGFLLLPALVRP